MVKKTALGIFIFFILTPFIYSLWFKYASLSYFSCSGNIDFHKESGSMRISTKLFINDQKGAISLNGVITDGDNIKSYINRTIVFNNNKVADRFTWVSSEIIPSIDEDVTPEVLIKWLPNFYYSGGKKYELFIQRVNMNSVILLGEFVPYYVCSRRH